MAKIISRASICQQNNVFNKTIQRASLQTLLKKNKRKRSSNISNNTITTHCFYPLQKYRSHLNTPIQCESAWYLVCSSVFLIVVLVAVVVVVGVVFLVLFFCSRCSVNNTAIMLHFTMLQTFLLNTFLQVATCHPYTTHLLLEQRQRTENWTELCCIHLIKLQFPFVLSASCGTWKIVKFVWHVMLLGYQHPVSLNVYLSVCLSVCIYISICMSVYFWLQLALLPLAYLLPLSYSSTSL